MGRKKQCQCRPKVIFVHFDNFKAFFDLDKREMMKDTKDEMKKKLAPLIPELKEPLDSSLSLENILENSIDISLPSAIPMDPILHIEDGFFETSLLLKGSELQNSFLWNE